MVRGPHRRPDARRATVAAPLVGPAGGGGPRVPARRRRRRPAAADRPELDRVRPPRPFRRRRRGRPPHPCGSVPRPDRAGGGTSPALLRPLHAAPHPVGLPARWAGLPPYLMVENSFVDPGWSEDRWAVTQSHQRHLAQVQYADHIVGQVMARLEEAGIYDEAIVVVTADHGIGIRPGLGNRRRLVEGTIPGHRRSAADREGARPDRRGGRRLPGAGHRRGAHDRRHGRGGPGLGRRGHPARAIRIARHAPPGPTSLSAETPTPVVYPSPFDDVTALARRRIRKLRARRSLRARPAGSGRRSSATR